MKEQTPIRFTIRHIGKTKDESISADSCSTEATEGNPPKYVFRKGGKVVDTIFVHALQNEPVPHYPSSPEANANRKKFVKKQGALNQPPDLQR